MWGYKEYTSIDHYKLGAKRFVNFFLYKENIVALQLKCLPLKSKIRIRMNYFNIASVGDQLHCLPFLTIKVLWINYNHSRALKPNGNISITNLPINNFPKFIAVGVPTPVPFIWWKYLLLKSIALQRCTYNIKCFSTTEFTDGCCSLPKYYRHALALGGRILI